MTHATPRLLTDTGLDKFVILENGPVEEQHIDSCDSAQQIIINPRASRNVRDPCACSLKHHTNRSVSTIVICGSLVLSPQGNLAPNREYRNRQAVDRFNCLV